MEEEISVRKDLNEIVKSIGFVKTKTKWGERLSCDIKFFNDGVVSIVGPKVKDLLDLLNSYKMCGETKIVKSKTLIEEVSNSDVDNSDEKKKKTYICVLFELTTGDKYRLFLSRWEDNIIIDNFYKLFKKLNSSKKAV